MEEDRKKELEYIKIKEWEEKFDREKKLKEQREILRDQRLREIELEKMRKFDELENQKNSIDYGLKNRSINREKIKQKELTTALDNFDIDKTKKN